MVGEPEKDKDKTPEVRFTPSAQMCCKLLTEELNRRGHDKLCIGLAGLPNLINRLRDSHESSVRIFQTMDLKPLEFEAFRRDDDQR
jgi:hypothetical protein